MCDILSFLWMSCSAELVSYYYVIEEKRITQEKSHYLQGENIIHTTYEFCNNCENVLLEDELVANMFEGYSTRVDYILQGFVMFSGCTFFV